MWAYETVSVVPNNVKVYLGYGSGITGLYSLGALRHWLPVRALPLSMLPLLNLQFVNVCNNELV